jgi:hypothetical protein
MAPLPDIVGYLRAQHQRMHPAAVPLCRVVKHAREWGATLAPLRILRFGDDPERLPLREIRRLLAHPAAQRQATLLSSRACRAQFTGWLDSLELAVARARYSIRCCRHTASTELAHGKPAGLGHQGEGRLGYAPQRLPAPTQAGESPWPRCWFGTRASPLHESLPERAQLHHHVGYGGSGTLHLAPCTHDNQRQAAPGDHQ